MRPLIRSLFLLSLTAAPLALAANSSPVASAGAESATSAAASLEPQSEDLNQVETDVRDLGATIDDLRREVSRIQENDDAARMLVIGDPNVHSLWP